MGIWGQKMDLDPSPSAGVQLLFGESVSNCKNLQYTKNFPSFMERIPYNHSNTILEKSRVKLIYLNYRAVHLFSRTKNFSKNGLGPQPAAYPFMTACVLGHSVRQ